MKILLISISAAAVFIFLSITFLAYNDKSTPLLKPGNHVPNLELVDDSGNLRKFSDFAGKKAVIYFYPKDDTYGCTKEACSLRDQYDEFKDLGITIIGISYDSPQSHKKFKEKYHLPFILLSDTDKKAAKAFGAYSGLLKFLMPKRVTFLVDEHGVITNVIENVDITTHAAQILKLIKG